MRISVTHSLQATVQRAVEYAREHLSLIRRRTGESYFDHSIEIADTLREITQDLDFARVALLHDILVCERGESLLQKAPLAENERQLIREMSQLRRIQIDENPEDLDITLKAFASDSRLLVLRMAHRINDLRHIDRFKKDERKQIAKESLQMYTAIAGRLGFNRWRHEMEDLAFAEVHPEIHKQIADKFSAMRSRDELSLNYTKDFLFQQLLSSGVMVERIEHRIKGVYSSYRKMVLKDRFFEELTDRLALRVIVKNQEDCYRALGVIHQHMHPIPGKLKDYIGAPKENGYRSIHTVVYPLPAINEQPMEIQIRSLDMIRTCEFGLASHGRYKELKGVLLENLTRANFVRNFEILKEGIHDPGKFEKALRHYFSQEKIMIFDEEDNPYYLDKPSGVLDFLFLTSQEKACFLDHVKVNGRKVALDTVLKDGDIVEFGFGTKKICQKDWSCHCYQDYAKALCQSSCCL